MGNTDFILRSEAPVSLYAAPAGGLRCYRWIVFPIVVMMIEIIVKTVINMRLSTIKMNERREMTGCWVGPGHYNGMGCN